jgi:hypothetical protein
LLGVLLLILDDFGELLLLGAVLIVEEDLLLLPDDLIEGLLVLPLLFPYERVVFGAELLVEGLLYSRALRELGLAEPFLADS